MLCLLARLLPTWFLSAFPAHSTSFSSNFLQSSAMECVLSSESDILLSGIHFGFSLIRRLTERKTSSINLPLSELGGWPSFSCICTGKKEHSSSCRSRGHTGSPATKIKIVLSYPGPAGGRITSQYAAGSPVGQHASLSLLSLEHFL